MTMTKAEIRWIAWVMHTISYLAFIDSCDGLARAAQAGTGESIRPESRLTEASSWQGGGTAPGH